MNAKPSVVSPDHLTEAGVVLVLEDRAAVAVEGGALSTYLEPTRTNSGLSITPDPE